MTSAVHAKTNIHVQMGDIPLYRAKREGYIGILFVREAFESWECETGV